MGFDRLDVLNEHKHFLKVGLKKFKDTGTLFPSSRWAAEALTSPLRKPRKPYKILEVGPGTGAITMKIMEYMVSGDRLNICELNPQFMEVLKKRVAEREEFNAHKDQISYFLGPVQELPEDTTYDLIICALPFTNFTASLCEDIINKLQRLSHKDTIFTFFEYIAIKDIGKAVSKKKDKVRIEEVESFFQDVFKKHSPVRRKRVWLNLLPINVYQMNLAA